MTLVNASHTKMLNEICNKILEIDSGIRFAGFISKLGRLVANSSKEGAEQILDQTEHEMLFMEVALRIRMRSQFDSKLGKVDYTVSKRRRIVVMSFPYKEHILYISAETDIKIEYVAEQILNLLKETVPIES